MNGGRTVLVLHRERIWKYVLSFGSAALFAAPCLVGQADVRKAVNQAIPATVAIEFLNHEATEDDAADEQAETSSEATSRSFLRAADGIESLGMASGAVISQDGLIVTHMDTTEERELRVNFDDGRQLPAKLLVDDRRSGLQLLKVEAEGLAHLSLTKADPELGQQVVISACTALKERAVATGIVSATNRSVTNIPCAVFQADATVDAMSAGAPLVDTKGSLLGIVVAMNGRDASRPSATLALPARHAQSLIEARNGEARVIVQRGLLGIQIEGPKTSGNSPIASRVMDGTPAAEAGIRAGDEIVAIGGKRVSSPTEVVQAVAEHKAGDQVEVTIQRDDEEQQIAVTLGVRETRGQVVADQGLVPKGARILIVDSNGIVRSITPGGNAGLAIETFPAPRTVDPTGRTEGQLRDLERDIRSLEQQLRSVDDAIRDLNRRLDRERRN